MQSESSSPPKIKSAGLMLLTLAIAFLVPGCSTPPASSTGDKATNYIVTAEETPFYKFGPAQANGADLRLKKDRPVTMVEKHYGYSRVRLDDGETGYVPTEDIGPSPYEPEPAQIATAKKTGGRGYGRAPDFTQPNDIALPSTQTPSDSPAPSFRY